jgi:hypothetical protein
MAGRRRVQGRKTARPSTGAESERIDRPNTTNVESFRRLRGPSAISAYHTTRRTFCVAVPSFEDVWLCSAGGGQYPTPRLCGWDEDKNCPKCSTGLPQRPNARGPSLSSVTWCRSDWGGIATWHQAIEEANPPLPRCEPSQGETTRKKRPQLKDASAGLVDAQ